jgi:hypothetical protein
MPSHPRVGIAIPGHWRAIRHLNVNQGDVGSVFPDQRDPLLPVSCFGDHLYVVLGIEQSTDPAADQRLVVDQHHPDHDGARNGSSETSQPVA